MTLIKSISGIRGTIGGKSGEALTPLDIVKYVSAFAEIVCDENNRKIVVGRDGRVSGKAIQSIVNQTLVMKGIDVISLNISTTPTVEMAVPHHGAAGGIILTASHNPKQWNALKLLNSEGEFISAAQGKKLLKLAECDDMIYASIDNLGKLKNDHKALDFHISRILEHPLVNTESIKSKNFKIIVDGINSTGATAVPALLETLGVSPENIEVINDKVNGLFAHDPEPLSKNLGEIMSIMTNGDYDLGIVVDPDVDRLCFVCNDGELFGEEYTLVAIADYVLSHTDKPKITVSNLSSSRALEDITLKHGGKYYSSAVGEVNVVKMMKDKNAVIGGEGNGGIIDPELHYGRDALVGIALFLSQLSLTKKSSRQLRNAYPSYSMVKSKIELTDKKSIKKILEDLKKQYTKSIINTIDGLKITFDSGDWVHLRPSNTEPIMRLYVESDSEVTAENIARKIMQDIKDILSGK